MRSSKILTVLAGACLLCGCVSPRETGRRDAQRDVSHGVLALEIFGSPRDAHREYEYERLLKYKYGISTRHVATNVVPIQVLDHCMGYNEVARTAIEQKYGTNFFHQAQAEARASYEQKRQSDE